RGSWRWRSASCCAPSASVHRDHRVAVAALPIDGQAGQRWRLLTPRMLGQHYRFDGLTDERLQRAGQHDIVIGRIEKDKAGGPDRFGRRLQPAHDVSADDMRALLEAERVEVLPHDSKTARLLIDERHLR